MMGKVNTKRGTDTDLLNLGLDTLMEKYPYLKDFFSALEIDPCPGQKTPAMLIESLSLDHLSQFGLDHESLSAQVLEFIATMEQCRHKIHGSMDHLVIGAGFDKNGCPEAMGITLFPVRWSVWWVPPVPAKAGFSPILSAWPRGIPLRVEKCCRTAEHWMQRLVFPASSGWWPSFPKT